MGRVIRGQRKGAGSIFKVRRKGSSGEGECSYIGGGGAGGGALEQAARRFGLLSRVLI